MKQKNWGIKIEAYCRLNFGLIDLSKSPIRIDGAYGIGINLPCVSVEVNYSDSFVVKPSEYKEECINIIKNLDCETNVEIIIIPHIERHIGLGFGTQFALAVAKALVVFFDLNIQTERLLEITQRGGTSNIGFYNFLNGGFILEGGHEWGVDKNEIGPGKMFYPQKKCPLIYRNNKLEWWVCVFTPYNEEKIFGENEVRFFKNSTPIEETETNLLCKYILTGILPAIETNNFEIFCETLEKSACIGFKCKEINYRTNTHHYIDMLRLAGFRGVSMSSLGPSIFGFAKNEEDALKFCRYINKDIGSLIVTNIRNKGAEVIRR